MKRKYYIHYYRDFANTYTLQYTETAEQEKALPEDAERITRKEAIRRARENRDDAFAGDAIFPADWDGNWVGFVLDPATRIVEPVEVRYYNGYGLDLVVLASGRVLYTA